MSDQRPTEPKKRVTPESFLRVMPTPFAAPGPDGELVFKSVPETVSERDRALLPSAAWRVVLTSAQNAKLILALELHGDVVIGSSDQSDAELDVNLLDMELDQRSVSQRHVKLRPSKDKLFLLDLGSKNGTYANGTPITPDRAYALQEGDLITLGRLHLRAKIAQRP
jgi:FHA domain-containing protein